MCPMSVLPSSVVSVAHYNWLNGNKKKCCKKIGLDLDIPHRIDENPLNHFRLRLNARLICVDLWSQNIFKKLPQDFDNLKSCGQSPSAEKKTKITFQHFNVSFRHMHILIVIIFKKSCIFLFTYNRRDIEVDILSAETESMNQFFSSYRSNTLSFFVSWGTEDFHWDHFNFFQVTRGSAGQYLGASGEIFQLDTESWSEENTAHRSGKCNQFFIYCRL